MSVLLRKTRAGMTAKGDTVLVWEHDGDVVECHDHQLAAELLLHEDITEVQPEPDPVGNAPAVSAPFDEVSADPAGSGEVRSRQRRRVTQAQ